MWAWLQRPHLGVLCMRERESVNVCVNEVLYSRLILKERHSMKCLLMVLWEYMGVGSGMGWLLPLWSRHEAKLVL